MPVPTRLSDMSTNEANNFPAGAETIGTSLDNYMRGYQAALRGDLAHKGADIASAGTTDLGAILGSFHDITGTTTITGLGSVSAGIEKWVKFEGVALLTHNATSLILPGKSNITTADGDVAKFVSEGSGNWRCLSYQKANGASLGIVLGTPVTPSSTSVDFTGIPAGVKRIVMHLYNVSLNGTAALYVQLGDSGGVETTGYKSAGGDYVPTANHATATTGFRVDGANIAADATAEVSGTIILSLVDPATFKWVFTGVVARTDSAVTATGSGSKALSAELDRVRLTTVAGTATFDAGTVQISWES
jgi:hypothetical protein